MTTPTDRVRAALEIVRELRLPNDSYVHEVFPEIDEALRELDGKVLVPVEPIGPMIMYGIHAHEKNDDLPDIGLGPKCVGIYRAMIAPYVRGDKE